MAFAWCSSWSLAVTSIPSTPSILLLQSTKFLSNSRSKRSTRAFRIFYWTCRSRHVSSRLASLRWVSGPGAGSAPLHQPAGFLQHFFFCDHAVCPAQSRRFYSTLLWFCVSHCGRSSRSLSVGAGCPARCAWWWGTLWQAAPSQLFPANFSHSCSGSCCVCHRFSSTEGSSQGVWSARLCRCMVACGCMEGAVMVHGVNKGGWRGQCWFIWFTWLKDVFQNAFYKNARWFILAGKQWKI